MGKIECPFVAWNKYDVLIILSFLLDDAMHVFIHVGSDKNVNPAIFRCFRIFLRFEIIFSDSNVAQLLDFFHLFLIDLSSKCVVQLIEGFNIGIIVVNILPIKNIKQGYWEVFVGWICLIWLKKVRIKCYLVQYVYKEIPKCFVLFFKVRIVNFKVNLLFTYLICFGLS